MRLSAIYRLLLVLLVVALGPRSHVKGLDCTLSWCCFLTCGISTFFTKNKSTDDDDKEEVEVIDPSSLTDVTWNLKFDSSTCIIKMKKKGTESSESANSKSQPNSGTGQSQPEGTPTTPTSPPNQSTPTNLTGTDGSANPNSNNNNGTQSQDNPTTPATPSTPTTPESGTPTSGGTESGGTPTSPSGTSSSKSSDKLQIVKNPYDNAFSLVFNNQVTYIDVNWMSKDVFKFEKAQDVPLSISLKLIKKQALVQLKGDKYNGRMFDQKTGSFRATGEKPLIKYGIEDIKFLKDTSTKDSTTNPTTPASPNQSSPTNLTTPEAAKEGEGASPTTPNADGSTPADGSTATPTTPSTPTSPSTPSGTDSTDTTTQNDVDPSKIKLLKFPLALVYKLSEGSNCAEIKCKDKKVWKKGHRGLEEYPVAVMFTLYREMCYIYFKDLYLVFEIRSGWEEAVAVQSIKFEDKDIKFISKEGMGTSDMGQDKFEKKEQEHEVEYLFKDGSKCTEVKWKGETVWKLDATGKSDKYPSRVYINRLTKIFTVEYNYLWRYVYFYDDSQTMEARRNRKGEEFKWEFLYKQEDGKDSTPEEPSYFTGEEVKPDGTTNSSNSGSPNSNSTPPTNSNSENPDGTSGTTPGP